jgi:hypothetical protein
MLLAEESKLKLLLSKRSLVKALRLLELELLRDSLYYCLYYYLLY